MSKVAPYKNSFNAGEFSVLVEGRVDIDRYPASMRSMKNFVAAPQGPAIRRSGTYMVAPVHDHEKYSSIVPFVFNEEQTLSLDFSDKRLRFIYETGIQTYDDMHVTAANVNGDGKLVITSDDLQAEVGDGVVLSNFPAAMQLNGRAPEVLAKDGYNFTLNTAFSAELAGMTPGAVAARVYSIETPYDHVSARQLRGLQSVDVVYLFCPGYRPHKLARYGNFDWRLTPLEFGTGPYMPEPHAGGVLQPSATGSPAVGGTAIGTGTAPGNAFDTDLNTSWGVGGSAGQCGYTFTSAVVITGYVVYSPRDKNTNASYSVKDYSPSTWTFEASNDGFATETVVLDSQIGFVAYDGMRSPVFKINNTKAFTSYRLNVTSATRNGTAYVGMSHLGFITNDPAYTDFDLNLSGEYGDLNKGQGFLKSDEGRLIRLYGEDTYWRDAKILNVINSQTIRIRLLGEPLIDASKQIFRYQLGYWSDTLGWPTCGAFFEDRLWMNGGDGAPDMLAGSVQGDYENFQQRTGFNEVLDTSAVVVSLTSRKLSGIRWMAADERGLLIGTGSAEWVLSPSNQDQALTAKNIKARSSTERGSADTDCVKVDRQVLYIQSSKRTVREYAYVYEADGYKSPSMSLFASHIGVPLLEQMTYASEPFSLVWFRRTDGSVVALTYNRDENVIGWHQHDFGGVVESIATIPSVTTLQDTLWMVVRRTINGETRRYIERLMRFWDFDSVIEDAHFVDCGLSAVFDEPVNEVANLWHLEGRLVSGLADGIPFRDVEVVNGVITLPFEASKIVVGLPYTSYGEISRIDAGSQNGTAQGKIKRINECGLLLWDSAYGEVGKFNEDQITEEWSPIEYAEDFTELQPITLQTIMTPKMVMPRGYGKRGSIMLRQTEPLPFNVISLMPEMETQDGG